MKLILYALDKQYYLYKYRIMSIKESYIIKTSSWWLAYYINMYGVKKKSFLVRARTK